MVMVIGQDHGDPLLAKGFTSNEELTEVWAGGKESWRWKAAR